MTIFRDELFGGSSYFSNEIWSKMESLSVLDVFCTDSECNTTLRSNFKKKSIFVIFDFFDCGFGHFDLRNFYQKVNSRSTDHFFMIYHQKPLPEKNIPVNSTYFGKSTNSRFSFVGQCRIFYHRRNFDHRKI